MTGSYFGLLGAFIGAVAAPGRDVPQLAAHRPLVFVATAIGCVSVSAAVVVLARRRLGVRATGSDPRYGPRPASPEVDGEQSWRHTPVRD